MHPQVGDERPKASDDDGEASGRVFASIVTFLLFSDDSRGAGHLAPNSRHIPDAAGGHHPGIQGGGRISHKANSGLRVLLRLEGHRWQDCKAARDALTKNITL